ncbi:MAG: hypothetical protein HY835_07740, partial [Anaerolineae bacterium]|nr:hypothetical protein [Anaerolineae bacterium]
MTERSLSGSWEICLLSDPNPPITLPQAPAYESQPHHVPSSWRWILDSRLDDQPYDLFHYPRHWNDAPAALLRRRFNVESRPGERVWLTFQGVLQRWVCFVNRVPLLPEGADSPVVSESFLPVSFDITGALQPGENELVVWTGAWAQMETPAGEKLTNPNGSWFAGLSRGIWQEVTLETRPA